MGNDYNNTGMTKPLTEADAQRAFEQTQSSAVQQISSLTQVKIDEKTGKGYVAGFEMSAESANIVAYVLSLAPAWLPKILGDGVYKHANEFYEYAVPKINKLAPSLELELSKEASRKFGLRAALGVSGILVAFQPVMEFVHGVSQSSKKTAEIKEQMAGVIAGNDDWKNNEVIKTAMEKSDALMWNGFKKMIELAPTTGLNLMYAWQGHKELKTKIIDKESVNDAVLKPSSSAEFMAKRNALKEEEAQFYIDYGRTPDTEQVWKDYRAEETKKKKIAENQANKPTTQAPSNETDSKLVAINIAGMGNVVLGQALKKSGDDKKTTAYSMILELQDSFANGNVLSESSLKKQIIEIIQANEVASGRAEIGKVLLEKLEPLADRVAEVIAKGELEPMALIELVGFNKIVKNRTFVSEEKLEEVIDAEKRTFGTHQKSSYEEFLADFQNPDKIMSLITENLKTLDGEQKALLATMLSDDVLLHAGMEKKEIQPLREKGHDLTYDAFIKITQELATHTPEEFKESGRSADEIKTIMQFNKLIEEGKQEEVKSMVDSGKLAKPIVSSILQNMENGKTWVDIVGKPTEKRLLSEIKPKIHKDHHAEAANDENYGKREDKRRANSSENHQL